ncbi:MAG: hypothetical protein IGS39_06435 [Calothrix sp. C42_A2020_038]|nr:hypothetical protein [Calothrix sp. C42_A2020_038]
MEEIIAFINYKKQEFVQLPLFKMMKSPTLGAKQKLIFAPCMAHFIMSFGDINCYILRNLDTVDPIQNIVNQYSYEDDKHWPWFITDIEQLGLDAKLSFTQSLRFIWSEQNKITRQLTYYISAFTLQASSFIKLVVIRVLEATSDVFFSISNTITSELQKTTNQEYLYFGNYHLIAEKEHTITSSESEDYLSQITLTKAQHQEALYVVEEIFNLFSEWTYELLAYARNHAAESTAEKTSNATLLAV